jgi:hypothetical protein
MTNNWAAEACSLPTVEQPLRVAEFDALFRRHLSRVERQRPTQAAILLSGRVGLLERVRDLAARESDCCSFFTFTTTSVADGDEREHVRLEIDVPCARADVLVALVGRAEELRPGASA